MNLIDPSPRLLAGRAVGALGYGCWRLVAMSPDQAQQRIEAALDAGMTLIDTADVYGLDWGGTAFGAAEELLGRVIGQSPGLRDRMVLATKGGIVPGVPYDSSKIESACEASLRRLGVDCIDLYQVHRPDLLTHPAALAESLDRLLAAGKIRAVGVSNFKPSQTRALAKHLEAPLVSQQPEYSALHLDPLFDGTFDLCMEAGQTVLVWSPLAGGRLATGEAVSPELLSVLDELAEREKVDRATLALAFVLAHPARPIALVGSIQVDRIQQAPAALGVQLDRTDVYRIVQASLGEALP